MEIQIDEKEKLEPVGSARVRLDAVVGSCQLDVQRLMDMGVGTIVTLDRLCGEPIDIRANGKTIAKAEVVVIDEMYGFRVTQILGETGA